MSINEVNVAQVIENRDRRVRVQNHFLDTQHCPVISFCMNIPGPIKTSPKILSAFNEGKNELLRRLRDESAAVCGQEETHAVTGDEIVLCVRAEAEALKKITSDIEENHPLGRLFDMDVIDTDGRKLTRNTFRRCLICSRQAQDCARSRRHSVRELQDAVTALLDGYF